MNQRIQTAILLLQQIQGNDHAEPIPVIIPVSKSTWRAEQIRKFIKSVGGDV